MSVATPRRKTSLTLRIVLGTALALGAFLVGIVWILIFGQTLGQEFSPDTFERRVFHYLHVPVLGVQVSPIYREDMTGDLEKYLVTNKLIKRTNPANPRWDLVVLLTDEHSAMILCRYLSATDKNGVRYWQRWSEQNPAQAKVFWPLVADVGRHQLYVLVPEMFRLAGEGFSATELSGRLRQHIAQQSYELGLAEQQSGHDAAAVELFTFSLNYAPRDRQTLLARAKCYLALGQQKQADDDRQAAAAAASP